MRRVLQWEVSGLYDNSKYRTLMTMMYLLEQYSHVQVIILHATGPPAQPGTLSPLAGPNCMGMMYEWGKKCT